MDRSAAADCGEPGSENFLIIGRANACAVAISTKRASRQPLTRVLPNGRDIHSIVAAVSY